jgi:hypothetical protein
MLMVERLWGYLDEVVISYETEHQQRLPPLVTLSPGFSEVESDRRATELHQCIHNVYSGDARATASIGRTERETILHPGARLG